MNAFVRKSHSGCPSRQAWTAELEGTLDDPSLLEHIEQCAACRRVLDEVAADDSLWKEASDTLATPPIDMSHLTASIYPMSTDEETSAIDPLCEHEIAHLQRLLPPASHPELLARIGRYDLEHLIGRGGMGLVFRAWDSQLHRVVALKTLAMALMPLGTARERFIREGRAAAMLAHPHIVPMYDVITELPVPALVMQYIAGPTLERWVAEHGAMPWQDAVRIGSQLADALDAAHAQGLVHRDIKPSNVLLEADGTRALLTDFGLVRAMDDAALTHSGMLAGTPHFMSPEQARSEDVDGRSDLFSLGSLLYFAMSGQPPFRGREPMAVLNRLCHTAQSPLCEVDREIPLEVSRLVDRLLSKQPGKRPATSREVSEELRCLLRAPRRLRRQRPKTRLTSRTSLLVICLACLGLLAAGLIWSSKMQTQETRFPSPAKSFPTASGPILAADPSRPSSDASDHEFAEGQPVAPSLGSAADRSAFADLESLAREAAELAIAIEVLDESVPALPAGGLSGREAFAPMSQAAVSLEAELEHLRQRQAETLAAPVNP